MNQSLKNYPHEIKRWTNHGEGSRLVAVARAARETELVLDAAFAVASGSHLLAVLDVDVGSVRLRSAGTSTTRVRISGVRAAELVHEVGDDTVRYR